MPRLLDETYGIQLLARQCEDFFHNVSKNAAEVGMTVSALKTQMVCISPASHHHVTSFINVDNGNKISSQTQLKQLGFWFGNKPNVGVHIEHIISKFRKRIWIVRHMKKAKIPTEGLRGIYQCFLLPIMDNSCVIYHFLMTNEQAARLERLQARTLRIIYGHQKSYAEILEDSGIERLSECRLRIIDRFIVKCAESEQFGERWFPKKEFMHMNLR